MGEKWKCSICTRFYPLVIVFVPVVVWFVGILTLFKADNHIFLRNEIQLARKLKQVNIGMTESELITLLGNPRQQEHIGPTSNGCATELSGMPPQTLAMHPRVKVNHYWAKGITNNPLWSHQIFIDANDGTVVYIPKPSLTLIDSFPISGQTGILLLAVLIAVTWLGLRFWCRRKVLRMNPTSKEK